jgi:hypothetical protein
MNDIDERLLAKPRREHGASEMFRSQRPRDRLRKRRQI